ncbi:hypothetical protein A6A12_0333 [Vibrio anguillarum]|nr:hypothetical protein A6A12_0333 [Vibrio anguillarum]
MSRVFLACLTGNNYFAEYHMTFTLILTPLTEQRYKLWVKSLLADAATDRT